VTLLARPKALDKGSVGRFLAGIGEGFELNCINTEVKCGKDIMGASRRLVLFYLHSDKEKSLMPNNFLPMPKFCYPLICYIKQS
jgi:hypothetical protein